MTIVLGFVDFLSEPPHLPIDDFAWIVNRESCGKAC